jgi:hypothetical protein
VFARRELVIWSDHHTADRVSPQGLAISWLEAQTIQNTTAK